MDNIAVVLFPVQPSSCRVSRQSELSDGQMPWVASQAGTSCEQLGVSSGSRSNALVPAGTGSTQSTVGALNAQEAANKMTPVVVPGARVGRYVLLDKLADLRKAVPAMAHLLHPPHQLGFVHSESLSSLGGREPHNPCLLMTALVDRDIAESMYERYSVSFIVSPRFVAA